MKELYDIVFDENGDVTLCGREACQLLILACEELRPGVDYGNAQTGFMNIENIQKLKRELS
jgi:hypothetical protein